MTKSHPETAVDKKKLVIDALTDHTEMPPPPPKVPRLEVPASVARLQGPILRCADCEKEYTVQRHFNAYKCPNTGRAASPSPPECPTPQKRLICARVNGKYQCPYCEKQYHALWLVRHARSVHPDKPLPLADEQRMKASRNREEQQDDVEMKCPYCRLHFRTTAVNRHIRRYHPGETLFERPDNELPPRRKPKTESATTHRFKCPYCLNKYAYRGNMHVHAHQMHKVGDSSTSDPNVIDPVPHPCSFRKRPYTSTAGLAYHMRTKHPEMRQYTVAAEKDVRVTVQNPFTRLLCPQCNNTFANDLSLATHLDRYHNDAQYRVKRDPWFRHTKCMKTSSHFLICPALATIRNKYNLQEIKRDKLFNSQELAMHLVEVFKLPAPALIDSPEKNEEAAAVSAPEQTVSSLPPLIVSPPLLASALHTRMDEKGEVKPRKRYRSTSSIRSGLSSAPPSD